MAKFQKRSPVEAYTKIDLEIKKAKESFEKIIAKKRVRRDNIKDEYVLTLTRGEVENLHEFIGNFSTDEILKLGFSRELDGDLEEIYSVINV